MDSDFKQKEAALRDDVYGAIDEVNNALESGEQARELEAGQLVAPLVARYQELIDSLPKDGLESERVERGLGRILTDLRRTASKLTQRDRKSVV